MAAVSVVEGVEATISGQSGATHHRGAVRRPYTLLN
jgi:hypothetical protein